MGKKLRESVLYLRVAGQPEMFFEIAEMGWFSEKNGCLVFESICYAQCDWSNRCFYFRLMT